MIIARSPLRITLGGGGTDLPSYYNRHGGFVISAAIDQYVYVTVNRPFTPGFILKYSKLEHTQDIESIQHPIVREALRLVETPAQIEITAHRHTGWERAGLVGQFHHRLPEGAVRIQSPDGWPRPNPPGVMNRPFVWTAAFESHWDTLLLRNHVSPDWLYLSAFFGSRPEGFWGHLARPVSKGRLPSHTQHRLRAADRLSQQLRNGQPNALKGACRNQNRVAQSDAGRLNIELSSPGSRGNRLNQRQETHP